MSICSLAKTIWRRISSISVVCKKQILFCLISCYKRISIQSTKHSIHTNFVGLAWNMVSFGKWSSSRFIRVCCASPKIVILNGTPICIIWCYNKSITTIIISRSIIACIYTCCLRQNTSTSCKSIIVSPLIIATIRTIWRNIRWSRSFVLVAKCNIILIILNNRDQSSCCVVIYSRQNHINCNWICRCINQIVVCI